MATRREFRLTNPTKKAFGFNGHGYHGPGSWIVDQETALAARKHKWLVVELAEAPVTVPIETDTTISGEFVDVDAGDGKTTLHIATNPAGARVAQPSEPEPEAAAIVPPAPVEKPTFPCEFCDRVFRSKASRTRHTNVEHKAPEGTE